MSRVGPVLWRGEELCSCACLCGCEVIHPSPERPSLSAPRAAFCGLGADFQLLIFHQDSDDEIVVHMGTLSSLEMLAAFCGVSVTIGLLGQLIQCPSTELLKSQS